MPPVQVADPREGRVDCVSDTHHFTAPVSPVIFSVTAAALTYAERPVVASATVTVGSVGLTVE